MSSWNTAPASSGAARPAASCAARSRPRRARPAGRARGAPMPSTLPISRSRGRTVDSTTSTTRLCFSSTTPVSTHVPYEKIPMNMRMIPALANISAVSSSAGRRLERPRPVGGAERGAGLAPRGATITARLATRLDRARRRLLVDDQLARRRQVGRDDEQGVDRPVAERGLAVGPVGDSSSPRPRRRTASAVGQERLARARRAPARRRRARGRVVADEQRRERRTRRTSRSTREQRATGRSRGCGRAR